MFDSASIGIPVTPGGAAGGRLRSLAIDYLADLARVLREFPGDSLERAIALLLETHAANKRVYVMGNGGSAATASHFVCDLVKTAHVSGGPRSRRLPSPTIRRYLPRGPTTAPTPKCLPPRFGGSRSQATS